ncbi:MAG TPA: Holliday junction branch migration protein RuvA [Actinomycetota bacterium]|nr:Holliday junction branch migration protein RuvA [Actinomycetota bacterium]
MIAFLKGSIAGFATGAVEVDVSGVGYLVHVPLPVLADLRVGESVRLLTYMVVREDSMTLFGFVSSDQKNVFQDLISVSGVGPKLALSILSSLDTEQIKRAVIAGDVDALTAVPGIGKRGAQRMVLELKDRMGIASQSLEPGSKLSEVREGLLGLGYSPQEISDVLGRVSATDQPVEDMIKQALKQLARV